MQIGIGFEIASEREKRFVAKRSKGMSHPNVREDVFSLLVQKELTDDGKDLLSPFTDDPRQTVGWWRSIEM
jgi:hypothetical protein